MSRPKIGESGWEKRIPLYLTDAQYRDVREYAHAQNVSIAEVARQALQFYLDTQAEVAAALAMLAEDVHAEEA